MQLQVCYCSNTQLSVCGYYSNLQLSYAGLFSYAGLLYASKRVCCMTYKCTPWLPVYQCSMCAGVTVVVLHAAGSRTEVQCIIIMCMVYVHDGMT